jgi:lipoprotein-releasing system ATP-binding protein
LGDEPTGNLDIHTAEDVMGALIDIVRRTGLAALVATHNLELARRMDRILSLEEGVVVERTAARRAEARG